MRVPHTRTLTLLLALGGVACSGTKKATEVPASLALDPTSLAFKTVAVGEGVELPISLHAQTASPVSVLEMKVTDPGDGSAAAFGLAAPPQVVSGNDTATVTVRFAPTAVRNYAATLVITSNDADHPTQQVALTGSGATRAISISLEDPVGASAVLGDGGASIAFVDPPGGASGIAWPQVLISNTGGIAANLTGFRFLHGDAGFFLPTVPVLPQAVAPEQTVGDRNDARIRLRRRRCLADGLRNRAFVALRIERAGRHIGARAGAAAEPRNAAHNGAAGHRRAGSANGRAGAGGAGGPPQRRLRIA